MSEREHSDFMPEHFNEAADRPQQLSRRAMISTLGWAGAALAVGGAIGGTTTTALSAGRSVTHEVYGCGSSSSEGLDCCLSVTIAELRSMAAAEEGRVYFITDDKRAGPFLYDAADPSSPDNGGTVLVSASGLRFKRRFDGSLNVKWFGAKGDGAHDDGPAIQAAIDAGGARSNIYFPQGSYRITSSLFVTQPEVTLYSDFKSEYSPRIVCTTPDVWMIRAKHYAFCMKGLQLEGDGLLTQTPYTPTVSGILYDRSDGTGAETLSNLDGDIQFCGFFKLKESVRCVGRNVFFNYNIFSNSLSGVIVDRYPNAECRGYRFVQNRFHAMGKGNTPLAPGAESWCVAFTSAYAYGNQLLGNMADFCKGFYKGPVDRCTLNDNQVYQAYGDGVRIVNAEGTANVFQQGYTINGNVFAGSLNLGLNKAASDAAPQMDYGIVADGALLQNGFITDNVITFPKRDGIRLQNLSAGVVQDNYILSPNKRADIDGSLFSGIAILGGTQNVVAGNMIRTTMPNGAAHKHGVANDATHSKLLGNFGFNQSGALIANSVPDTTDLVEPGIPRYAETYKRDTAAETFGMRMYTNNAAAQKTLFGEVVARQQSSSAGAEKADLQFNAMSNGVFKPLMKASWHGALSVGDRAGQETLQNGYVNAKALNGEFVSFLPTAAAAVPNASLFLDSADGKLKFKDGTGAIASLT